MTPDPVPPGGGAPPPAPGQQPPAVAAVKDFSAEPVTEGTTAVVQPYDPEPAREKVRANIAYILIFLMAALVLAVAAMAAWAKPAPDLSKLTSSLITPIVGLVGTVLGFYYAGKSTGAK